MKTVLLLEDEPINRSVISAILNHYGYRVLEAGTVAKAIQICAGRGGAIDLLIADVQLPDGSGAHAALEAAKHCPKMPMLFISGTPMAGWRDRDLSYFEMLPVGMVDFLPKPFVASVLVERAEMLLNGESAATAPGPLRNLSSTMRRAPRAVDYDYEDRE